VRNASTSVITTNVAKLSLLHYGTVFRSEIEARTIMLHVFNEFWNQDENHTSKNEIVRYPLRLQVTIFCCYEKAAKSIKHAAC